MPSRATNSSRRPHDDSPQFAVVDKFTRSALRMVTSSELANGTSGVRRRIVLNRARAQQRGARTRNQLSGVGLSSSAESTAHQSNRGIESDQWETEVP
ncbi:hypothetical protein C2E31_24775 [Rhodopirellula baltica]|nr:hypothetical protein C2E31_24775 [Rhodopirellula baltica]